MTMKPKAPKIPEILIRKTDPCHKLFAIYPVQFGRAGGTTCKWKTETCKQICYGKFGPFLTSSVSGYLKWMEENLTDSMLYDAMMATYTTCPAPFRIGKVGDCMKPELTQAICDALKKMNVPFMWPTRAWLEPTHRSWEIIERELPRDVICSEDASTVAAGREPPKGWPRAYISCPSGHAACFEDDRHYHVPYNVEWCRHYPDPRLIKKHGGDIVPVYNCLECGLCYGRVGDKRPNVAFALHSTGDARNVIKEREHARLYSIRKGWLNEEDDPSKLIGPLGWLGGPEEEPTCGWLSPGGWIASGDDV